MSIVRCSPDWNEFKLTKNEIQSTMPLPGWGNHTWKISTTNDSAQFYFNQGINLYYGFHIIESMASFKKAQEFDNNCAMLYWAEALAMGPNINDYGYTASPEAITAVEKANSLNSSAAGHEKFLIEAMSVRYSRDSSQKRPLLNQNYADRMKAAHEKFPKNADIHALYVDALMLQHPWDLWFPDGKPKAWTPEIRKELELLLAYEPNHPGANHYYIHTMEPSPFASLALPSADRLGALTPGIAHLVHMPSHIYLRTGHYNKGSQVNESAVKSYGKYLSLMPAVSGNDFLYKIHNLHMQTNCAMLNGRYDYTMQSADQTRAAIPQDYLSLAPPFGSYMQYMYHIKTLAKIKFGKWDELTVAEKPDAKLIYANVLYHFGRGMAFAGSEKLKEADQELLLMQELMKDSILYIPFVPFSAPIEGAKTASSILAGVIHQKKKDLRQAIRHLEEAVKTEENMVYNEPRDWLLSPGPWLGAALIEARQYDKAEAAFRKDLQNNSDNGWSLVGLQQALKAQGKNAEAQSTGEKIKKAFADTDILLKKAVY
jgi:tetratricopeptide (TPR) repeat protein